MQTINQRIFRTIGASLALTMSLNSLAMAHDGHDHGGAQHGGVEAKTKQHHFEAVFTSRGVKLYAHNADHKSVDGRDLKVTATFFHPSNLEKPWFSRDLKAPALSLGQPAESLDLAVDLSKVPATGGKVTFQVAGLPSATEPATQFTVPLTFTKAVELAVAKATPADQRAVEALKVCPVSGEDLGSMGGPLKVTRGDQSTFICCKGCLKQLKANPSKYFASANTPADPKAKQ